MKIAVTSSTKANTIADRLREALGEDVEVFGPDGDLSMAHLIVTEQMDQDLEARASLRPVIVFDSSEHGRTYWLERGIEWVPYGEFDELAARCRLMLGVVRPRRQGGVPAFDSDPAPMEPRRITQATFQIVAQVCPDSVLGFYQLVGQGELQLFAETEEGFLPSVIECDLPANQWFSRHEESECELCLSSNQPLIGESGACYMAHVESETRRYGLLVAVQSRAATDDAPREALVHAARQLAYGLEASYLFSQVRRAYGRLRETRDQLVHSEKFAAVGLLAAEVAHEINNPASFVITNLSVLGEYAQAIANFHDAVRQASERGLDRDALTRLEDEFEIGFLEEDVETLIRRSLAGLERIHQIVQDLRFTSNVRSTSTGWVNVERLIEAAMGLVRHEAKFRTRLTLDFGGVPMVDSDPNRLSQVFLNLLVNAVQAIPPGHLDDNEVVVSTRLRGQDVVVSIRDSGDGVPDEICDQIFDPFFTTKAPGDGTGLGLSISRDVVRALGGKLTFETEPGVGSNFEVSLPVSTNDS